MKAANEQPAMAGPILDNFARLTGIKAYPVPGNSRNTPADAAEKVHFGLHGNNLEIAVCILDTIHYDDLSDLIIQRDRNGRLLLLAGVIQPRFRKELQRIAVNYIDSSGNAFISLGALYIYIDGRSERIHGELEQRVFSKSILRVIFHLLHRQYLSGDTLRDLGELAGVSSTPIRQAMDCLKELGFYLPGGKRSFRWNRKKELLDKWVQDYHRVLKPDLHIGNFNFKDQNAEGNFNLGGTPAKWSGAVAAELLTGKRVTWERTTIYMEDDLEECINRLQLVPDGNGKIGLCKTFWKHTDAMKNIVPPVLIYADLVESADSDSLGVAQYIYQRYLAEDAAFSGIM